MFFFMLNNLGYSVLIRRKKIKVLIIVLKVYFVEFLKHINLRHWKDINSYRKLDFRCFNTK